MTPQEAIDWCEQFTDNLVMCNVDSKRRTFGKMCAHPKAIGWDAIEPEDDDYCNYGVKRGEE